MSVELARGMEDAGRQFGDTVPGRFRQWRLSLKQLVAHSDSNE